MCKLELGSKLWPLNYFFNLGEVNVSFCFQPAVVSLVENLGRGSRMEIFKGKWNWHGCNKSRVCYWSASTAYTQCYFSYCPKLDQWFVPRKSIQSIKWGVYILYSSLPALINCNQYWNFLVSFLITLRASIMDKVYCSYRMTVLFHLK